jgi:hypothetical protein
MCAHICILFTLPHPFPSSFLLPLILTSPERTCSFLLFSDFVKGQKLYFCLFKIATHGIFYWHFHVCMYYNPNWFISSIFLLSTLVLFLWWSPCLKILYSFLYREYINYIHLLNFFYPPSLICDLLLEWTDFHSIACICIRSLFHLWEKTLSFWPSEPKQLHFRWCSPISLIYLQTTKFHSFLWLNKISLYINTTFS